MLLGCIADDLTGATDLCLMLARGGMHVVQAIGVPEPGSLPEADAVVVALKSRTIPATDAVAQSLRSLDALLSAGARQIFFKYCSTFDSTDAGNIGPVAEALMARLEAEVTIACPAFPAAGRTIYLGHLFVGGQLLSDSPMRDHPLTPMRDADLVRVLQRQTALKVGLLPFAAVDAGPDQLRGALEKAQAAGTRILIVDAVTEAHLHTIGAAVAGLKLVTGGSGIALGLPENFRRAGATLRTAGATLSRPTDGAAAILAGSCSAATQGQVAAARDAGTPSLALDPMALADGSQTAESALQWARGHLSDRPLLIYSTANPQTVAAAQQHLGRDRAAAIVEKTFATLAPALVAAGVNRMIVAGGETSGAVVEALGVKALAIGPEIDPGVPWTQSMDDPPLLLALKSGNFGTPDFFLKAWERIA